jgi:hypothetical protein
MRESTDFCIGQRDVEVEKWLKRDMLWDHEQETDILSNNDSATETAPV